MIDVSEDTREQDHSIGVKPVTALKTVHNLVALKHAKFFRPAVLQTGRAGKSHHHNRGSGLIDVLVTLTIIAIGMMGTLQLYLDSLGDMRLTADKTLALLKAESMGERIYANRAVALSGLYQHDSDDYAIPSKDCATDSCSGEELATYDIHDWQTSLPDILTSVSGEVLAKTADNKVWSVIVRWQSEENPDEKSPSCIKIAPSKAKKGMECVAVDIAL